MNLIGWWYGAGFLTRLKGLSESFGKMADRFSIGLLFKTWFNPFRQIDANAEGKGPSAAIQAFLSRLISRLVGFVARTVLIVVGIVVLVVQGILSVGAVAAHLVVPILPIAGLTLMIIGWVPEINLW